MLTRLTQSEPGDAFNQFWNAMQGMLDNLSQPVAFATAPLGTEENVIPSGSHTPPTQLRRDSSLSSDDDEHMLSKWTRRIGLGSKSKPKTPSGSSSFDDGDDLIEEGEQYFLNEEPLSLRVVQGTTSRVHSS